MNFIYQNISFSEYLDNKAACDYFTDQKCDNNCTSSGRKGQLYAAEKCPWSYQCQCITCNPVDNSLCSTQCQERGRVVSTQPDDSYGCPKCYCKCPNPLDVPACTAECRSQGKTKLLGTVNEYNCDTCTCVCDEFNTDTCNDKCEARDMDYTSQLNEYGCPVCHCQCRARYNQTQCDASCGATGLGSPALDSDGCFNKCNCSKTGRKIHVSLSALA